MNSVVAGSYLARGNDIARRVVEHDAEVDIVPDFYILRAIRAVEDAAGYAV